jgi:hypothetical protein
MAHTTDYGNTKAGKKRAAARKSSKKKGKK